MWRLFDSGWEGKEGRSVVPSTTDRSVVGHPSTFDLYLYEGVRNGGGKGGSYSAKIELDQTVLSSTDCALYHLHGILAVWEFAQVQGSG